MNIRIKKIFAYLILMGCISGLSSCTSYLDRSPESNISSTEAYKNFTNFQGFVEELYSCIPLVTAHGYHNSWNWGEEELWETDITYPFGARVDQGDYWSWSSEGTCWLLPSKSLNAGHLWGNAWYAISKANLGLANLDKMTSATTEEKNLIAGQLYFFRAWFHFMLMQYWGGLPYINTVLSTSSTLRLPRLTYQAMADSAAVDFQRAANLLPIDWDTTDAGETTEGNNNIRINKIMALAYLGKDMLWAGSPLMNYTTNDYNSTYACYNTDDCKKAAEAFGKVLHLCDSTGRYQLASFSNYSQIFYTHAASGQIPGLKEAIFMENLTNSTNRWRWNQVNDYRPYCINASGVKHYPTANYVDYFGMANGLPITDATKKDDVSGYDPEYPWKNRDPRFYKDIIYDGVQCCTNSKGNLAENQQYASLYTGGYYRTSNGTKACLTGYLNCKFISQYMNDYDGYKDNNVVVLSFMRLADVYLMYAEAVAEGYGTPQSTAKDYSMSAASAVNVIRDRAGVGEVAYKYLGDLDSFMSEVRRERAVELAFEGHRFVDLRRWMLFLQSPYTLKKAVYFDRASDQTSSELYANPQNEHVLNLTETTLVTRQLRQKHYWLPLQKSDVKIYKAFYQNPGW